MAVQFGKVDLEILEQLRKVKWICVAFELLLEEQVNHMVCILDRSVDLGLFLMRELWQLRWLDLRRGVHFCDFFLLSHIEVTMQRLQVRWSWFLDQF